MNKIGIFYGTTSGSTAAIVEELEFYLKKFDYEVFNVTNGIDRISEFENLILVTPTYGVGEVQKDWDLHLTELKNIDFSNKKVGIIGLGNQLAFGESFVGGMKILFDIVTSNGGKIIGLTPTLGYSFKESHAVINNQFVGLALDESHDNDLTPDRIHDWLEIILKEFA